MTGDPRLLSTLCKADGSCFLPCSIFFRQAGTEPPLSHACFERFDELWPAEPLVAHRLPCSLLAPTTVVAFSCDRFCAVVRTAAFFEALELEIGFAPDPALAVSAYINIQK